MYVYIDMCEHIDNIHIDMHMCVYGHVRTRVQNMSKVINYTAPFRS